MSQTSSIATALSYDTADTGDARAESELGPTLADNDARFETWRANTRVRVVRDDSVVQFVASSRGQAGHLLDQAFEILLAMDARRARRSHLHPSWPS